MSRTKKGLLRHFDQFLQNERFCIIDDELNINQTPDFTTNISIELISIKDRKDRYFKLVQLRKQLEEILTNVS